MTYLINASEVWFICIVHTNLSTIGKSKHFHVHNCPCGTVGTKIGCVLGLLVHGKVVVKFGRKVFLVDCLLWKTLNITSAFLRYLQATDSLVRDNRRQATSQCTFGQLYVVHSRTDGQKEEGRTDCAQTISPHKIFSRG